MRGVAEAPGPGTKRLVMLLALGAGAADAIIIVGFQVLTAAQTGNTILLATALAQGQWHTGLASGLSVAGFVTGALAGSWLLVRDGLTVARVLALEFGMLVAVAVGWLLGSPAHPAADLVLVAATASAMGLQSAVMLHQRTSSTTYVTGVLAAFARHAVSAPGAAASDATDARFEGGVWLVYFSGAIAGAWLYSLFGVPALFLSAACIAVSSLVAAREARIG
jgi:uncharacterized membrane protein YoaK (UPF0700 family)